MKKLILLFAILMSFTGIKAQNAKVDASGNYSAINHSQDSTGSKNTGKIFTDNAGNKYPVLISAKGKLFYMRTSKAGNLYRAYLKLD